MKRTLLMAALCAGCALPASNAMAATTFTQMPASATHAFAVPARSVPAIQPKWNLNRPLNWRPVVQMDTCRIRSFFASDISKPLDAVYFARHGTGCTGYTPMYGFVILER